MNNQTVVLMQVCGAVLTPWRHNVSAILAAGLDFGETLREHPQKPSNRAKYDKI